MRSKFGNFSPSLSRIVLLSVMLTLAAQFVLVYIGLSYANSIDNSINGKRKEVVLNQIQQNVLYQLNDINNLLLLLQTPEFSSYFKNLMRLRDTNTVAIEEGTLLGKLNGLMVSPDVVESIYFIGAGINQMSGIKRTSAERFDPLPRLNMELLRNAKLENMFLVDHDQFKRYSASELKSIMSTENQLIEQADVEELDRFVAALDNRLIIANGNENGVFTILILNDDFLGRSMPNSMESDYHFSVVEQNGPVLWSTSRQVPILSKHDPAMKDSIVGDDQYSDTVKDLNPFKLRIILSSKNAGFYPLRTELLFKMARLSLITVAVTLLISLFYIRRVFRPYRLISRKLKSQAMMGGGDLSLRALSEEMVRKGFHSISMRNKLIFVFFIAVSVPAVSDGILYSGYLNQDVNRKMMSTADDIGSFSLVSIRNRAQFIENTVAELSVSQQFQNVLRSGLYLQSTTSEQKLNLTAFPGLNDVAYFVLLDEYGTSIYSSIFSNNKDFFQTDPKYLLDRDEPYWISNFKDVFNHISTAVVKQLKSEDVNGAVYLLFVPKESIFENVDSSRIDASYVISDKDGKVVFQSQPSEETNPSGLIAYANDIPDTDWHIDIRYVFNDVIDKNRVYQEQFLLSMVIVFMLSIAAAVVVANLLSRPIQQLKDTMLAAGNGDLGVKLVYHGRNEIGDIIRSYNQMIGQLEQSVQQNMRMMEENARNKIRENELVSMKTRAELQMLQAQINPHFLYNTLEAINMRGLKSGNAEISAIVSALADLFRYSVSKGSDTVELEKELAHAANYLTIQQIRFGRSFEYEFRIPEALKQAPVMRFIFQPILENAIKHGLEGWETGGLIVVQAEAQGDRLRLSVTDNGVGMNAQTLDHMRNVMKRGLGMQSREESGGIGLHNVYARLRLYYKEEMSMRVNSQLMAGTEVIIELPLSPPDFGIESA